VTYVIFKVKQDEAGKINQLIKDDLVSRQSIVTRESNALDLKEDATYVKVEGSDTGIKRAEKLAKELGFTKLPKKKAASIDEKIKLQEDSAATGMGMIFD
jgi:hypothetical protein